MSQELAAPFVADRFKTVVVGGTGAYGQAQIQAMRNAGTKIAATVSPGRSVVAEGIANFNTVQEAVDATGVEAAVIYTPAAGCADSIVECASAGLKFATAFAEFMPVHDVLYAVSAAREAGMWVVGPNTLGMGIPRKAMFGSLSDEFTLPGPVALFGRSGTLSMTAARLLSKAGLGQTVAVHMGGDMLCGRNPHEYMLAAAKDPATKVIVYMGEIGGTKEYEAVDILKSLGKPVATLIIGAHSPAGKRMGHAGAMIEGERGTAKAKRAALKEAGAHLVDTILDLPKVVKGLL